MTALPWVFDDGGRADAGFKGTNARDCVTRSITIATRLDYTAVYAAINDAAQRERPRKGRRRSAANTGVHMRTIRRFLDDLGWVWTPTMFIGSGTTVHLAAGELPPDQRLIVSCSRHVTAVIDDVIHDTHDPARDGTRCVYGYWRHPMNTTDLQVQP